MTSPTFEVRGLNVSSFSWQANNGAQQFREALAPAKAMGVNTLIFDIALEQDSLTSSQVRLTSKMAIAMAIPTMARPCSPR
jgi:uncharacterized lipoprotein YddW (UPF0748 family)